MDLLIKNDALKKAEITAEELLIEIAVHLYDTERLSMGQASALCEMNILSFQQALSKRDVYIKYDIDDLETDLRNLKQIRSNKKAS